MDLGATNPVLLITAMIGAATPILLAAIGELVAERAGVLLYYQLRFGGGEG